MGNCFIRCKFQTQNPGLTVVCGLFPAWVLAAAWTGPFKITGIDVLDSRGFSIMGNFPKTECTHGGGQLFVDSSASQYKNFLATAQLALVTQASVNIYFSDCRTVGFYVVPTVTFPTMIVGGAFRITSP